MDLQLVKEQSYEYVMETKGFVETWRLPRLQKEMRNQCSEDCGFRMEGAVVIWDRKARTQKGVCEAWCLTRES